MFLFVIGVFLGAVLIAALLLDIFNNKRKLELIETRQKFQNILNTTYSQLNTATILQFLRKENDDMFNEIIYRERFFRNWFLYLILMWKKENGKS